VLLTSIDSSGDQSLFVSKLETPPQNAPKEGKEAVSKKGSLADQSLAKFNHRDIPFVPVARL
jgi:hypothetical protein